MAARKNHTAKAALGDPNVWRRRIETSKLINRLQNFAKGKLDLNAAQVKAAEILLRKVLPDQTENKTEHSGMIVVAGVRYTDPNS